MILVLLGPPGVGKGTQSRRLCKEYRIVHLSTGQLLRQAVQRGDELGGRVARIIQAGQLVPDQIVIELVTEYLRQHPDCLLDGFPRTVSQAEALDRWLAERQAQVELVVELQVQRAEIVRRLLERARIEGRADDTPTTIAKRLDVYHRQTHPVAEYYRRQGRLATADGNGGPEEVFQRIRQLIDQRLAGRASR